MASLRKKSTGSISGASEHSAGVLSFHSSGGSSSASASSKSSDSVLPHNSDNLVVEFRSRVFVLFAFLARSGLPPVAATIFWTLDLIQLLSFAFSGPFAGYWQAADDNFLGYLDIVRTLGAGRTSYATYAGVFWFVISALASMLLLAVWIHLRLARGEESWNRITSLLRWITASFAPVLYMPAMSYLLVGLSCRNGYLVRFADDAVACPSAVSQPFLIVGPLVAVLAIAVGFLCSALFYQGFPDAGQWFSGTSSRAAILIFTTKTALALCAEFVTLAPRHDLASAIYGLVGSIGLLASVVFVVYTLPFHRAVINCAISAALSVCCLAFGLRFTIAFFEPMVVGAYTFSGLLLPTAAAVAFGCRNRARRLSSRQTRSFDDGTAFPFEKEFEVEIATRFAYGSADPELIDEAMTIYIRACERFNHSAAVRIGQVTFMVSHMTDYQLLANYINRAKRTEMMPSQLYALYRVDARRKALVRAIDGGEEEITEKLARATRYQEQCKRWIRAFWQQLARDEDLSKIPQIVSSIDMYERKADEVYKALLLGFPSSARVVRAFGVFLAEVKVDHELSQIALRNADELEEERARHAHKRKGVHQKEAKKRRADKTRSSPMGHSESSQDKAALEVQPRIEVAGEQEMHEMTKQSLRFETDENHGDLGSWEEDTPREAMEDAKASIQVADADHRTRREELQRFSRYRRRLEQSKSIPLQRLGLAVKVTMLVMLIDVVVIYASTKAIVQQFTLCVEVLDKAGITRNWVSQQAMNARTMHEAAAIRNDTATFEIARQQLEISTQKYEEDMQQMRYGYRSAEIDALWDTPDLEEVLWRNDAGKTETFTTNMYDLSAKTITASWAVSQLTYEQMKTTEFAGNENYRFILDNFNTVSTAYKDALMVYAKMAVNAAATMSATLYTLLPVSVIALLLLAFAVFRPTLRRIREERESGVRLFTAVPKEATNQIFQSLAFSQKEDLEAVDEDANAPGLLEVDVSSESEVPVLRSLSIRYFGSLAVIVAIIGAMFGLGIAFPSMAVPGTYEVMWAYNRFADAARCQQFTNEIAYAGPPDSSLMNDNLTWVDSSEPLYWLGRAFTSFRLETYGLKYGNASMELPGQPETYSAIYDLLYKTKCHLAELGDKCKGLDALNTLFLRDVGNILSQPSVSLNSPIVKRINFLLGSYMWQLLPGAEYQDGGDGELSILLRRAASLYKQRTLETIASVDVPLLALFVTAFPVLLAAFVILRPLENRIRQENIRTMKMLLMVPGDVITKVPALLEYLDTGKQENAQQKLKDALDEYVARNESILGASVDGIVVVNSAKQIEMFSPAAQRIFGYAEDEVKGKNVNVLMEPEVAAKHDGFVDGAFRNGGLSALTLNKARQLVAVAKDDKRFPILLSLNLLKVNEKFVLSAFIRDISSQKEKDAALQREKEKSEKLLQALLPSVIAEQLKEEGLHTGGDQLLHAEGYKEVSVLFADLVGFTKMSAGIPPSELVFTLNQLFSIFDLLCDKHNLEKIKTIGDCYMVAGGCPERSVDHPQRMLEFAIDMLDKLAEYNAQFGRQLKLRIGMNVGPVVAGVLGLKKITYDLWGDAVNVASRMESAGVENRIQVSHAAFEVLKHDYIFEERGKMEIKGKGLMLTYLYKDRKLSKTASGTLVRRAVLTPPPGAGSRRPSNAGLSELRPAGPTPPETARQPTNTRTTTTTAPATQPVGPSVSEEINQLMNSSDQIRSQLVSSSDQIRSQLVSSSEQIRQKATVSRSIG